MVEQSVTSVSLTEVRRAAMDMLSRRDFSQKDLIKKLQTKFPDVDSDGVEKIVGGLASENLQSDKRFCEALVNVRYRKGYGPSYIKQKLSEHGIHSELSDSVLWSDEYNWHASAFDTHQKKYGNESPKDFSEKSKRMRFLQYRGFTFDQIESVFDAS